MNFNNTKREFLEEKYEELKVSRQVAVNELKNIVMQGDESQIKSHKFRYKSIEQEIDDIFGKLYCYTGSGISEK